MKTELRLQITCSDPIECSATLLRKLGHGPGLKLMAETASDTVHGSLSILHTPGDHTIIVELYDEDKEPTAARKSRLASHPNKPTRDELLSRLTQADPFTPIQPPPGLLAKAWDNITTLFS